MLNVDDIIQKASFLTLILASPSVPLKPYRDASLDVLAFRFSRVKKALSIILAASWLIVMLVLVVFRQQIEYFPSSEMLIGMLMMFLIPQVIWAFRLSYRITEQGIEKTSWRRTILLEWAKITSITTKRYGQVRLISPDITFKIHLNRKGAQVLADLLKQHLPKEAYR